MIIAETCLSRARGLLNDTVGGAYRWDDAELLVFLNASLDDFFAHRSDCLLKPDGTLATEEEKRFDADGGMIDFLADKYAEAIAYGCAARALELDNNDTANQERAIMFFQRAAQERMK